jgi:hypothetical protein
MLGKVRFQVVTAASMKMTVFRIRLYCSVMLWIFQLMILHKAQSAQLKICDMMF